MMLTILRVKICTNIDHEGQSGHWFCMSRIVCWQHYVLGLFFMYSGTSLWLITAKGLAKFVCDNKVLIHYIKILFHIVYYYWGKENHSLYRGLCYIEVCYMKVPVYWVILDFVAVMWHFKHVFCSSFHLGWLFDITLMYLIDSDFFRVFYRNLALLHLRVFVISIYCFVAK